MAPAPWKPAMNGRRACVALAAGAGVAVAGAWTLRAAGAARTRPSLLIGGASAMLPLTTALARGFLRERADAGGIVAEAGGSLPAYIAASRGAIDVAAMTRALSDAEDDAARTSIWWPAAISASSRIRACRCTA